MATRASISRSHLVLVAGVSAPDVPVNDALVARGFDHLPRHDVQARIGPAVEQAPRRVETLMVMSPLGGRTRRSQKTMVD
jgi:hypothetical protein